MDAGGIEKPLPFGEGLMESMIAGDDRYSPS